MPSDAQHHRIRGLATLRRLGQDVRSAFSRHPQATLNASGSGPAPSIYTERLLYGSQIRVLHILPSPERDRRLECKLKLISLDDAPVYEALSYVWGTEPPSVTIVCNGKHLTIRPELSYALARLRLKHITRIIWADALCINQNDNQEKSHQVPLMSMIFSQAATVNVWLGHGDESVIREAFRCCKLIADAYREFSLEQDLNLRVAKPLRALNIPTAIFTPIVLTSLSDLFRRPLFTRVWCIQEIKLAQNARVIWGEQALPWVDVGQTALWVFEKEQSHDVDKALEELLKKIVLGNVDVIYDFNPWIWTFLETLTDFRRFQSTDPRDKVYGLIGLVRSTEAKDLMVLDYGKSASQVFTDTALHTITSTKNLLVFTHVVHHTDYDGDGEYRSWAPRWDLPRNVAFIFTAALISGPGACGGREAQFVVTKHPGGEQLCLTGIFHARIITIDSIFGIPRGRVAKSDGLEAYHQVMEVYEGINWNDPMSDVTLPVIARTLTLGESATYRRLNKIDDESSCAHYEAFRHCLEWYRDPKADYDDLSGDALQYHDTVRLRCNNLRFFWTSNKDYGIGPACMREGDVVVVFYGGGTPCVLRPKGDRYLLLGTAYVDSIMNGELVKEVEEGKRQEQEFCLI